MNCEDFNERLPEYLDEVLSRAEQAAAREHVEQCAVCRQTLARQEAFAKSIRRALDRQTQGLSLSAETRQNILNASKQPAPEPTSFWERLREFCALLFRKPAWAGLALVCFVLVISGIRLHRLSVERSSQQTAAQKAHDTYVIDVPIETEMHLYRRQKTRAIDAVVPCVTIINASFSENKAVPLKRHVSQN